MIKTRLLALLSEGKKYIIYQVLWQWAALLGQIISVFAIGNLVQKILEGRGNKEIVFLTLWILILMTALRFLADQMAARMSYAASAGVKRILRDKIYEKLLKLGASYRERISSAEAVQMSVEGVEQLETYFGRYLPQLFYSILAPVTLFLPEAHQFKSKCGFADLCPFDSYIHCGGTENCKKTSPALLGNVYTAGRQLPGKSSGDDDTENLSGG